MRRENHITMSPNPWKTWQQLFRNSHSLIEAAATSSNIDCAAAIKTSAKPTWWLLYYAKSSYSAACSKSSRPSLAVSTGLAVLLILYLLYFMRTNLLQLFQHDSLFKKGLAGALTGAGVWWMLSFTISELLFLIILAAIQQIGSFIYKRLSYPSSASLDLWNRYIAIADGPAPTGITVTAV